MVLSSDYAFGVRHNTRVFSCRPRWREAVRFRHAPRAELLIGGWQLSGICGYQSGAPIGFGNVIFNGNLQDLVLDNPTVEEWFNVDAGFVRDSKLQLRSKVRTFPPRFSFLRTDPISNHDFGIIKKFYVQESKYAEFRAEFLNAFNHPNFPAPNTTVTTVSFGRSMHPTRRTTRGASR